MSRYNAVVFEHLGDKLAYQEYFPTESGISEMVETIYEKMGDSSASFLFRGNKRGYPYTIKVYKNRLPLSSEVINERLARLKKLPPHPRVCRVLDFLNYESENRSFSYVKMEFVQGKGLDVALREVYRGHCPQKLVLNWAWELLEGLQFLHSNYISVHLTLSNIVLNDKNNSVCISDISHLVSQKEEPPIPGTNIPDEQLAATGGLESEEEPVIFQQNQVRRDIFHLGAVLFELFTGQKMNDQLKYIPENEKKRRLINNGATSDVADVIVKAINANRSLRYGSAAEMMDALKHLPLNNQDYREHTSRRVRDFLTTLLCVGISLILFNIGWYQNRRVSENELLTQKAEAEWSVGRYTQAWSALKEALEDRISLIDPPSAPVTLQKTAEYLGVYQFNKGYKPHYSTDMVGQIVSASISPSEDAFAVMTKDIDPSSLRPVRRIYILSPENGQKLNTIQASAEAAPELFFLNDSLLVYTDVRGQFAIYNLETSQSNTLNFHSKVSRIALAGDKRTAACLCEDGAIYTVQLDTKRGSPRQDYKTVCPSNEASDVVSPPENRLFALNENGTKLAISFASGNGHGASLRVYVQDDSLPTDKLFKPDEIAFREDEVFDHFEGGFWEDRIAFVAWSVVTRTNVQDSSGPSYYSALYALEWNDSAETYSSLNRFYRYYGTEVHASVDKNGIYFSHNTDVEQLRISDSGGWYLQSPLSVDAGVRYLQHIQERTLLISRNNSVEVLLDIDSASFPISSGISFSNGVISDHYVLLFDLNRTSGTSQYGNTLSVMKWSDANVFLHYTNPQYRHQRFQVVADKSAVVLYGLDLDSGEIFTICPAGADGTDNSGESVHVYAENPDELLNISYLSPTVQTDPQEEYLKAVYFPDISVYYSAKTGEETKPEGHYLSEEADAGSIYTKDYQLRKSTVDTDTLEIINRNSGKIEKKLSVRGLLAGARQCENPDIMLVSIVSMDSSPYALLLNSKHEEIARIHGSVTMLDCGTERGTLYLDDGNGYIICGKVYSKAELLEELEKALVRAVSDSEELDK